MKVFKIVSDILIYILIAVLSIYFVINIICRLKGQKLPSFFGYYIFEVKTGSMEQGIHIGDYIVVKESDIYVVDDIVTYQKNGYYITHRIVEINGDKVITKGDANNISDDEFLVSDIIGKYVFKSSLIKFISNYRYFIISLLILIYLIGTCFKRCSNEKIYTEK